MEISFVCRSVVLDVYANTLMNYKDGEDSMMKSDIYTEQQKKRIFCIFSIVYKLGFKN